MSDELTESATTPAPPVLSHLVYLDVDDEITSAATRIRSTEADRITLVLPYGSRLATSRINFRLLAREAAARGKELDIVCADASARALAAAAGLPVHASVAAFEAHGTAGAAGAAGGSNDEPGGSNGSDAAVAAVGATAATQLSLPELADDEAPTRVITSPRRSSPKVPRVGPARPPVPPRVAVAAGFGVLAGVVILGLLAFELLPSATIVLHPRSADLGPLQLTVEARADTTAPDSTNLVIPAQRFTFPLEATKTFSATGTNVVEAKATGNVTFANWDTGSGEQIPAGSVVKTEQGVEFTTLATVTLPAATFDFFPPFATHPSTSTVGVEAVLPGPDGNVGNNAITVIPKGHSKRLLKVSNQEPTSGGAHDERVVVSAVDVTNAQIALNDALQTQLDTQVTGASGVPSGVALFPETATVGETTPSVDTTTLVGTEATEFDLGLTAEGSVLGVDPSTIQALAESRLEAEVEGGWTLAPGSTTFQLGEPSVFGDVVSYPVTISGTEVHDVDQAKLIADIRGLVLAQARSRLDDFGDVSISLWPDWVTTIPTNDDRIQFTIAEPQPAPSATPTP
jgi:hypothetical protein